MKKNKFQRMIDSGATIGDIMASEKVRGSKLQDAEPQDIQKEISFPDSESFKAEGVVPVENQPLKIKWLSREALDARAESVLKFLKQVAARPQQYSL